MPRRGEKIEAILDRLGETPSWLARQIGTNRQNVINWIDGMKPQDEEVWTRIANALNVKLEVLLDDTLELAAAGPMRGELRIPSDGNLGTFRMPLPDLEIELPKWPAMPCDENWDFIPDEWPETEPVPNLFARRRSTDAERIVAPVTGNSMEPRLYEGDLVVVELDREPRTGRIVVARSEKGRTLKVLMRGRNGALQLIPINPDRQPATAEKWDVEGYVIGILRGYKNGRGMVEWDFGGLGP